MHTSSIQHDAENVFWGLGSTDVDTAVSPNIIMSRQNHNQSSSSYARSLLERRQKPGNSPGTSSRQLKHSTRFEFILLRSWRSMPLHLFTVNFYKRGYLHGQTMYWFVFAWILNTFFGWWILKITSVAENVNIGFVHLTQHNGGRKKPGVDLWKVAHHKKLLPISVNKWI